jgi:preprotein translocase subunit YajC
MFDFTKILVSAALAQDAVPVAAEDAPSAMMSYLPFVLIFGVFYFLVIRPQQKKLVDQEKMIKALQRGDRVVTSGGIHGKIAKIESEGPLLIEVAEGVQIKIDRDNVVAMENALQISSASANGNGKK